VHSNAFVFLDHAEFGVCEMMRSMTPLVLGVTLLAAMAGQTQADNFYFTFTDTAPYDGFNVPGTVTGEILGLTDNVANQQAAEVVVFSFPPIFGPYVATAPNTEIPVSNNLFSVSDVKIGNQIVEMITAFYFEAGVEDNVGLGGSPLDAMRPITGELFVDGATGPFEPSFTIGPMGFSQSPNGPFFFPSVNGGGSTGYVDPGNYGYTPEPASLTMLGTGLFAIAGFGFRRWRRRVMESTAAT
jgi:hypothetical protein